MNARTKCKLRGCTRSCVIRTNAAMLAATPAFDYAQQYFPLVREYVPANVYAIGFVVIILVNIILRFRTKVPLEEK